MRIGLVLRRRRGLRWSLTVLLGLAVATSVASVVARADRARSAWGETRAVFVATRDLEPGHVVRAADARRIGLPEQMLRSDAMEDPPIGRVVHSPVFEHEVLIEARLAAPGLVGLAAVVPEGSRAVAIPAEPATTPAIEVGQLVDVIVVLPPGEGGSSPPGFVLAADAEVLAVTDRAVSVAVETDVAPRVAVAVAQGAITLAVVGS